VQTPAGRLLIWRATAVPGAVRDRPGTLVSDDREICVATGAGLLRPETVQPESRKAMAWGDFLRGARLGPGARFTELAR
jgi:methionyl-tRNA formyltransferase